MNCLPILVASAALGALASAQSPLPIQVKVLVREGDLVAGVGNVTSIENLAIDDQGTWLVEADTNHVDAAKDGVVLRDGALYLRQGDPLPAPAGATIGSFDSITLDNQGHSAWNLFLAGTGSTSTDSGVYRDLDLQIQESTLSTAAGFSAGTPYIGWFEVKPSDSGAYIMVASVDDPAIASTVDRALVLGLPAPGGGLGSELVLWKEGDVLPGQVEFAADFGTGPHSFAINASNQVLFVVDLNGDSAVDGAIYLSSVLLAQEGSPSPIAGRNWIGLTAASVDLNDAGDYVHTGSLEGDAASNLLLVKNGQKLVQEGDSLPDIAPFAITAFGSGPVAIDRDGDVVWFGDWNDPDTTRDTGLFWNDRLLVQEGVTLVGGVVLESISFTQDSFSLSDDGRFLLFEGMLAGGIDAALLLTPAGTVTALPGCAGNQGSLALAAGSPSIGSTLTLALHLAQANPSAALLAIAGTPAPGVPPCGLVLPGIGELLVGVAPAPFLQGVGVWTGSALSVPLAVPASVSLVDAHAWFQGAFVDVLGTSGQLVRLTNGLEIRVGGAL